MTYYLSPSTLKLVKECHACFWWHIKHKIKRLNAWESNLPNVIEKQILNRFREFRIKGILPPELDIPELKGFRLIDEATHKKWKDPHSHEPCYNSVDANPDDVLTKGKEFIMVDIKTLGKDSKNCTKEAILKDIEEYNYKLQSEVYNYVFRNCGMRTPNYSYLLFYYIKGLKGDNSLELGFERVKIDIEVDNVPPLVEEAKKILQLKEPPNVRCKFCSSNQQRYEDYLKEQEKNNETILFLMKEHKRLVN